MSRLGKDSRSLLQNFGIALILVAAVVAVYSQSFDFGALRFDDPHYIAGSGYLENG